MTYKGNNMSKCQDKTHEINFVPDYHPLTWRELQEQVGCALDNAQDSPKVSQVFCRLAQAIPGHVYPNPCEGPIHDKMCKLARIFSAEINPRKLTTDRYKLAKEIGQILNVYPKYSIKGMIKFLTCH